MRMPAHERPSEFSPIAARARELILRTIHRTQAGHVGGPLSVVDILTALYFGVLRVDPARPQDPDRDRLVLSKGHSCVALYAILALRGFIPVEELATFDELGSRLQGHPDMTRLPALDMSTGSLGQGFSAAVGIALGARMLGRGFRTFVILGDGELQEGQVWEGARIAARYALGNLTAIVDWNGLQQYGWWVEAGTVAAPAPDAPREWEAFGWDVEQVDGHDLDALVGVCGRSQDPTRPRVILARTVKGKGVSFMENRYEWHARPPSDEELELALAELGA
jgi:transketolase